MTTKPKPKGKWKHGTAYTYRRLGCRCVDCKKAQAEAMRDYRYRKASQR